MSVKDQLLVGIIVHKDIVRLSRPPTRRAYTYERMWAYSNHYCVDIELGPWHLTYDLGWLAYLGKLVIAQPEIETLWWGILTMLEFWRKFWLWTMQSCWWSCSKVHVSQQIHEEMQPYVKMNMGFGWGTLHIGCHPWWTHMFFLCLWLKWVHW
jgi:hypothetical protein